MPLGSARRSAGEGERLPPLLPDGAELLEAAERRELVEWAGEAWRWLERRYPELARWLEDREYVPQCLARPSELALDLADAAAGRLRCAVSTVRLGSGEEVRVVRVYRDVRDLTVVLLLPEGLLAYRCLLPP